MASNVKRFEAKKTAFPGRTVKKTTVRHARTESKGRAARPMKSYRGVK